jgi:hypothetical protein
MLPNKQEKTREAYIKNVIKFFISYLLILIPLYLIYPKFDTGFLMFIIVYLAFGLFAVFYYLKYPAKIIKLRERYNKKTPAEIAQHMSGMYIYTAKVLGIAFIIMFLVILVAFVIIFSLLTK